MIKIRASAVGKVMTNGRSKTEPLGETCKTYLRELWLENETGRKKDIVNKYILKGTMAEEDSITLYSRVKKQFFKKNADNIQNDFITGTPDIITADTVIDIKTSWDIYTFFAAKHAEINKDYWWQLQSYMALTKREHAVLVYCLVDTPEILINDEKHRLFYKMGALTDTAPEYEEASQELEKQLRFEDIPLVKRVFEIYVERDNAAIESIYQRVTECRTYYETLSL